MTNLLFTNVELYDGTGKPPCHADVAVQDDKIVTVAPSGTLNRTGSTVVDGGGKALVPGFVDVHTHSDAATYRIPTGVDSVYVNGKLAWSCDPEAKTVRAGRVLRIR